MQIHLVLPFPPASAVLSQQQTRRPDFSPPRSGVISSSFTRAFAWCVPKILAARPASRDWEAFVNVALRMTSGFSLSRGPRRSRSELILCPAHSPPFSGSAAAALCAIACSTDRSGSRHDWFLRGSLLPVDYVPSLNTAPLDEDELCDTDAGPLAGTKAYFPSAERIYGNSCSC